MTRFRNRKSAELTKEWPNHVGPLFSIFLLAFALAHCQAGLNMPCLSNPCIYGICLDDVNGTFLCYCIDGYTGLLCQTNWDECWSNPCLNGGVCVDGIAQYNCTCPQGYQGDLCEQDINECDSNPCHNNGTCVDGSNGYSCLCSSGYSGDYCETDVSVCNDTREAKCLNGGLCTEGPGLAFTCACPLGWSGQMCEEAMDECVSSPCQNGAVCLDLHANYVCACPFGFTGKNCEVELEMCGDESPCQNGALCLVEDWLRICYCVPDFHGDRCQFRYNECLLGPGCFNGGTCIDGIDGYDCSCPPGWSGKFCECLIMSDDKMDCGFLLPPAATAVIASQTENQPVPSLFEVPKTMPPKVLPTNSIEDRKFLHAYPTECFPIWPEFTPKPTTTPVTKPTPFHWLTVKLPPATTSTTSTMRTQTIPMTTTIGKTVTTTTTTTQTTLTTTTTESTTTPASTTTESTTTPTTTTTEATTTQTTPTTTTTEATTTQTTPITTTTETTTTQTTPKTTTTEATTTRTARTTPTTTTMTEGAIQTTSTTESTTTSTTTQMTPTTTTTTTQATTPGTTEPTKSTFSFTEISLTTANQTDVITKTEKTPENVTIPTITTPGTITETSTLINAHTLITEIRNFSLTTPTTQTPATCRKNLCLNGGTCLNTTTGPRCVCVTHWEGPRCAGKADLKIAGFSGQSFVSHELTNTHSIKIDLTARTLASSGLLLYSHLGPRTFLALYLEDGYLKFRFSCGVQTMVLSEVQFLINNGFDLVATVTLDFIPPTRDPFHCSATVRVNNTLAMTGEQLTKGSHADSGFARVYVGGVPRRYVDPEEIPVLQGFTGCIQKLMINGRMKGIFRDSFESAEISECKSLACLSNPCQNGGSCIVLSEKWTCMCPSGFLGDSCETSVCKNNPCQFGGTCVPFPGSGFLCLCPLGKQGLFCESRIETGFPFFASSIVGLSSFSAYKIPTEIYQDMQLTFKFVCHDIEQISLMLFLGQDGYHGATSDHLAVSFIKGFVVLTWNLGSGPRRIFTETPVANTDSVYHTVQIGRAGQRAWLVVDDQKNVTGRSPGKLSQLNAGSTIYLGGHDSWNFSVLPHDLPLHTGFSGCLFDVELRTGQMLVKVEKSTPAFSRGVGQCGTTLCNKNACENGGGCIHHGATFTCLCAEGWFGPTCAMAYNPCDSSRHNCSEGSTCVPVRRGFVCDCPVGKTGKYCDISEELSDVKLTGTRSYLALAVGGLQQYQSCIDIEIRPLSNHGLVMYSGRPEGSSFWSLYLNDGVIELRISPGIKRRRTDVLIIKSRRLLILGKWYRIRAGRYGRRLFLWVEGTVSTGVLLPGENLPSSGVIVYIGGAPDLSQVPFGAASGTLQSFKGCVRNIVSQWRRIPLTTTNILEGRNIEDCDGTVCGGDVCGNGGTCYIDSNNKPYCTCLKQYAGTRCEYRHSCKEINCQNGGRCSDEKNSIPQCHCPNGWSGPFCESALSVKAPHFGGNSYLLIDRTDSANAMKRDAEERKVPVHFIYLNFSTPEPNGILLWSSSENSREFIGIGVEKEKVKIVWAWEGRDPTIIRPSQLIADGAWHDLTVGFDTLNITIWIDQNVEYSSSESYPGYPLTTNGKFFLGGFPENTIANRTLGHFRHGFDGCLEQLAWEPESSILNFSKFKGENIRTCDPFGV